VKILIAFALLLIGLPVGADEGWKLWRDHDEIRVYSRPSEQGYADIRATTTATTTLSAFLALLHDTAHVPEWMDTVSQVAVIEVTGPSSNIVHTQFQAPWPVANRDMVTYSEYSQPTPCSLVLNLSDRHEAIPPLDGYVRITDIRAQWVLTALPNGSVDIEYQAHANTSGYLPRWMANRASLRTAYKTFQALRRELADPRYLEREMEGISECQGQENSAITAPRESQ